MASDYRIGSGNILTLDQPLKTTSGIGAVNADARDTVTAVEYGTGAIHKTVFTFADFTIPMADEGGVVGYGGKQFYDMPEGVICFIGASSDLDVTKSSAGIDDDWNGDFGVGTTTAGNNAALATTEQNVIPTTATAEAVAGLTAADGNSTALAVVDGSATPADLFLNFLVDDGDQDITSTPANIIVNGTVTVLWANLGDN